MEELEPLARVIADTHTPEDLKEFCGLRDEFTDDLVILVHWRSADQLPRKVKEGLHIPEIGCQSHRDAYRAAVLAVNAMAEVVK
jgi:hypothetical protein